MKSMGNMEHLHWFTGNIIYMFIGGIVMTLLSGNHHHYLLLQSSHLLRLVLSLCCGNRMCTWSKHRNDWNDMVSRFASLRWYVKGDTLRIAIAHTGVNLFMAASLLLFAHHIARFLSKIT